MWQPQWTSNRSLKEGAWVRPARLEDAAALCSAHVRSIQSFCAQDYPPEQIAQWVAPKTPAFFEHLLRDPGLRLWAGLKGEEVLGVACLDRNGWVMLLYVAPEAVGLGLGHALLHSMEQEALSHGLRELRLKATVTAASFYRQAGYEDLGLGVDGVGKACHRMRKRWP